jgi:thiamine-phosphate pyrophosphorylase
MDDKSEVYRIIDANLNRLREGLRTVEEQARFLRDDTRLTERSKDVRHQIKILIEQYLEQDLLILNRDSVEDVGQKLDPQTEMKRTGVGDILITNLKRTQEAARVLEEYSKLIEPNLSSGFKNIRFDLYNLEQAYFKAASLGFTLYLLADGPEPVEDAIQGGVDLVQFRDKASPDSVRLEKIKKLLQITKDAGVPLIINDRPDLCVLTNAAGVHLGQDDMPVSEARRIVGPGRIIGYSTHSLDQAIKADEDGADYIAIGPVFPTDSKGIPIDDIGLDVLKEVVATVKAPVVAIGGINADNLDQVLATGVKRIAVIGGILGSGNVGENARTLKERLSK